MASAAAHARWDAAPLEGRSDAARKAVAARWAGHEVKPKHHLEMRPCKYCGRVVPMSSVQRSCGSQSCKRERNAERMREGGWAKARRAQQATTEVEIVSPLEVFERDGWLCGICGKSVSKELRWPDPMSASIDHVQPLSLGGAHTMDNLRCVHLRCNIVRGNRDFVVPEKTCLWCGNPMPQAKPTGRPARFCSTNCRVSAHRARKRMPVLPPEMLAQRRWVRRDGKRPITVMGAPASSTKARTWVSFAEVFKSHAGNGFGFMLGGGIGCLDLDHCLTPTGPSPLARRVLDTVPATYVEVSPSGTGLHVFGLLPEGPGRKVPGVEVYSRARFMTVTGEAFDGSAPVLGDLSVVAAALVA